MQPKPGVLVLVVRVVGVCHRGSATSAIVPLASRTAQPESSKSGLRGRRIGRDSDPPALVQNQRRAQAGGVDNRRFLRGVWSGPRPWAACPKPGRCACGDALAGQGFAPKPAANTAMAHSNARRTFPPEFLRALQFNSAGCGLQTKVGFRIRFAPDTCLDSGTSIGSRPVQRCIHPIENVVNSAANSAHTNV